MGKIKRYYTALFRLKRSKGYGIHSPFAFHFVLRVLREKSLYYSYEHIDKSRRVLFRIACYFVPQKVLLIGENRQTLTAIHSYSQSCEIYTEYNEYIKNIGTSIQFIVVDSCDEKIQLIEDIKSSINNEAVIVFYNINKNKSIKSLWNETINAMQYGMTFTNYKTGIIVALRHLPRHNYNLWL